MGCQVERRLSVNCIGSTRGGKAHPRIFEGGAARAPRASVGRTSLEMMGAQSARRGATQKNLGHFRRSYARCDCFVLFTPAAAARLLNKQSLFGRRAAAESFPPQNNWREQGRWPDVKSNVSGGGSVKANAGRLDAAIGAVHDASALNQARLERGMKWA